MKIEISLSLLHEIGDFADAQGVDVYVVGGFVRDFLLGRPLKEDIDLVVVGKDGGSFAVTLANEIGALKVSVYPRFGTASIRTENVTLEFVGARKESYSPDSRNPVVIAGNLEDDLKRRDFTINAIAVSLNKETRGEVIDLFGGLEDLKKGIIRTPIDPEQTFNDDPLRQLRAVRFASVLGFRISDETAEGIKRSRHRLNIIVQERITEEIRKTIKSPHPGMGIQLLQELGLLELVLPEVFGLVNLPQASPYHSEDAFEHTCLVVQNVAQKNATNEWLRWAALLHDVGKPATKHYDEVAKRWKFVGHEQESVAIAGSVFDRMRLPLKPLGYVQQLIAMHMYPLLLVKGYSKKSVRRLVARSGDLLDDLFVLARSDLEGSFPPPGGIDKTEAIKRLDEIYRLAKEIQEVEGIRGEVCPVTGEEIMAIFKIPPGKRVGEIKKMVTEAIISGRIPNRHDDVVEFLKKLSQASDQTGNTETENNNTCLIEDFDRVLIKRQQH